MSIKGKRVVARLGQSAEIPPMIIGEFGWDVDRKRLRVGDGTTTPPMVMTTKSTGPFEFNNIHYAQYPEIRMLPEGTVDGVDLSRLNAANGIVVRRGNNLWAHRTIVGNTEFFRITNGDGVAGNPTFDFSVEFKARLDAFLSIVYTDQTTILGDGRQINPLYAVQATTERSGVTETATEAEALAGQDNFRYLTPFLLRRYMEENPSGGPFVSQLITDYGGVATANGQTYNYNAALFRYPYFGILISADWIYLNGITFLNNWVFNAGMLAYDSGGLAFTIMADGYLYTMGGMYGSMAGQSSASSGGGTGVRAWSTDVGLAADIQYSPGGANVSGPNIHNHDHDGNFTKKNSYRSTGNASVSTSGGSEGSVSFGNGGKGPFKIKTGYDFRRRVYAPTNVGILNQFANNPRPEKGFYLARYERVFLKN